MAFNFTIKYWSIPTYFTRTNLSHTNTHCSNFTNQYQNDTYTSFFGLTRPWSTALKTSTLNHYIVKMSDGIRHHTGAYTRQSIITFIKMLFVWWCLTPLSTIFQLYRGGLFYWWRTRRKPPTCRKSLTNSHNVVHLALIEIRTHISGDRHWLHR